VAFTFFFRDMQTLELAVRHALPRFAGRAKVRVWDAGCATGPEVYSLAILLAENMTRFGYRNIRIDATDIDENNCFGTLVREAVYPSAELDRVPVAIREKYFTPVEGGRLALIQSVRERVHFRKHDLVSLEPIGDGYSLIVCKNVLLHLTPEQREQVVRMFCHCLEPGGLLVMEQTQKLPPGTEGLFCQVVPDAQLFTKVQASTCSVCATEPCPEIKRTDIPC
jgi:chemotaxis protein methyltransferase CheR